MTCTGVSRVGEVATRIREGVTGNGADTGSGTGADTGSGTGAGTGSGTVTGVVAFYFGKTLGFFLTYHLLLAFGIFQTRKVK